MLVAVLAAFLQTATSAAGGKAILKTIDKGTQTLVDNPRQVTVRSPEELTKLWRAHAPERVLPSIDFSRDMIVGVFLGSRPTAGYDVEIVSVGEGQGALIVRFRTTEPGRDTVAAQILTAPYHLAVVPRYAGTVKFENVK